MSDDQRREKFHKWFLAQFGEDKLYNLVWDRMTGYTDEMVNSLWIGFNAGAESVNW